LTLLQVKIHLVTFVQRLETASVDTGMMDKYILSIFLLNKAVAFAIAKPFYCSISHRDILLSKILKVPNFRMPLGENGSFLQNETGPPIKGGP